MRTIPVMIDCDTGVDDAIALLMALRSPELRVRGITTVAGNVDVEKTTVNTLRVLELASSDVPVFKGASRPLMREPVIAGHVHGKNGLGDIDLPLPVRCPEPEGAAEAIFRIAREEKGKLEVIAIGPLTNLAHAFIRYKELPSVLKRITIMGGTIAGGNVTPAAEFNIFSDPEAADIVFRSGVPIHMCGLDVTMQGFITRQEMRALSVPGNPVGILLQNLTKGYFRYSERLGLPGICLHDPITVAYVCHPELFAAKSAGIRVETKGRLTYGKTVCDLHSDQKFAERSATVVTGVDRCSFIRLVTDRIASYGS